MKRLLFLLLTLPGLANAATLTNAIQGVGPNKSVKPWICLQNGAGQVTLKLSPGQSGDANKASGNPYYAGATLRFDGCESSNSYLGYVGFSISSNGNNSINGYTPPEGVHVAYVNPAIDSQGRVTGAIDYTPIDVNLSLSPAFPTRYWPFAGFNLSGLEFGKSIDPVVIPNISETDGTTSNSDLSDTQAFINAGMNTARIPLSWGYLQLDGPGVGNLNQSYYINYVQPLVASLTQAKVHTIIDLHAYMRYSKFGEQFSGCSGSGPCPDGQMILDEKAYQSVWGQLADTMLKDPAIDKNYLMFDLVNEPVNVPDDKVFTIQASLIKFLRARGFKGVILVEGNSWSGLHSWTTETWKGADGKVYSNATLFTRDNFTKAGITDLSNIIINVHQYLDSDYSGTHDDCLQDLSTTGQNGFNLTAFADYLQENKLQAMVTEFGVGRQADRCSAPLQQFMQYMQTNSVTTHPGYGFAGWTIWSTGHGWGDYNLRVKPASFAMQVISAFLS